MCVGGGGGGGGGGGVEGVIVVRFILFSRKSDLSRHHIFPIERRGGEGERERGERVRNCK